MKGITVNSHCVEFGYELVAVLPYAYYLFMEDRLEQTISGKDTKHLYYFSPNHVEVDTQRHWDNMQFARADGIPNIAIHKPQLDYTRWNPPPFRGYYKYQSLLRMKAGLCHRTVVISNKKNNEWGRGVINNLDTAVLESLFGIFKDWTIVYNSTYELGDEYDDTVPQLNVGGVQELLRKHKVRHIKDLMDWRGTSYNLTQLVLYPHVDLFISIQGGSSILASYFGAPNIIYAVEGQELVVGSYTNWYSKFGGSEITHVSTYEDLIKKCYEKSKV